MRLVVFGNFIHHHLAPTYDEFASLEGVDFHYVMTEYVPDYMLQIGYPNCMDRPYVVNAVDNEDGKKRARQLAIEADVAIIGGNECVQPYRNIRLKAGKLTFETGERWFKKGYLNLLSPRLIRSQIRYHLFYSNKPYYYLCKSAYAANDLYFLHSFVGRCFKWAYFTKVDAINVKDIWKSKENNKFSIMWCARFIDWKHPEIPVLVAKELKKRGVDFEINMYGAGPLKDKVGKLIEDNGLSDFVRLQGTLPNNDILKKMQEHHVFLFTSDRNEGWGAVANEAMSNGAVLIASNEIGAVPFLVQNKVNGIIYQQGDKNKVSFIANTIERLNNDRAECARISRSAYNTMYEVWSPRNAAQKFIKMAQDIQNDGISSISDGPCSAATPFNGK